MSEMYENKKRTTFFKRDESLESALKDLNELIEPIKTRQDPQLSNQPIILIMGCPRSGSTLMMQWLASTGLFSYPSNLIARFYKNPYIGIRAQQALLEFDPINQLGFENHKPEFSSSLGKTIGALEPSEYWYFWREYFKFKNEIQVLSDEELLEVDGKGFLSKLSAFELLTHKPLLMKGMLLNWNIPYLHSIHKKFLFINVERDSFSNAQSLLLAREKFFNDRSKWYSFKPLEYSLLKNKNPITQVAGQVVYTRKSVSEGLSKVPSENRLNVSYTEFCDNPDLFLTSLLQKYKALGGTADFYNKNEISKVTFDIKNSVRVTSEEEKKLREKIEYFENN